MTTRLPSERRDASRSPTRPARTSRVRRRRFALWVLAFALLQPTLGSAFSQSALALLLHGDEHAHRLVLVPDAGHFDVVLAHSSMAHPSEAHPPTAPPHDPAPARDQTELAIGEGSADRDHVRHGTASDEEAALRELARPPVPGSAVLPAVAFAGPRPVAVSAASGLRGIAVRPPPPAAALRSLRTVVLRL